MAAAGYFGVFFLQAHGLIPNPPGVQTRANTLDYGSGNNSIDMKVLSIPGDQYISGKMGPMNWPPTDKPHWEGLSTELVLPGVLRGAFMGKCDNIDDIREAFIVGTENVQVVYNAAHIKFSGGGFTEQHNPPEDQFWQLKRSPGENCRKTPSELPKRATADSFQVMPNNEYGMHCIHTDHPGLKPYCLTSIADSDIRRVSQKGHTDIIPPRFYPSINMIGHDDAHEPQPLGARYWMSAIRGSKTDQKLKDQAIEIIMKAFNDKQLYLQHFIIVLQALGIRHAWLYNPTCRNLCEELDPTGHRPPSPLHNEFPDSSTQRSPSPPPSPPQSPATTAPPSGIASFISSFNPFNLFFKGVDTGSVDTDSVDTDSVDTGSTPQPRARDDGGDAGADNKRRSGGGSRKTRKRTTVRRKKITRKTNKRTYKKKSQKRNRRK
jgi:hypothetical protein